jgi:hypothetical protein
VGLKCVGEGGDTWVGSKCMAGGQDMLLGVWIGSEHVGGDWNMSLGESEHVGGVKKTPPSHASSKGNVWW